jgi:hypothetical protein
LAWSTTGGTALIKGKRGFLPARGAHPNLISN